MQYLNSDILETSIVKIKVMNRIVFFTFSIPPIHLLQLLLLHFFAQMQVLHGGHDVTVLGHFHQGWDLS